MEDLWGPEYSAIIFQGINGYHLICGRAKLHEGRMHLNRNRDKRNTADLALNGGYERGGIDDVQSDSRKSQSVNR